MPIAPPDPGLSPRLQLPLLFAGQAQKELTLNEAMARLDGLVQCTVEGTMTAPPVDPGAGQMWLVGPSPQGAWAGLADHLACWHGGSWLTTAPRTGMILYDRQLGSLRCYRDSWSVQTPLQPPSGGAVVDSQARTAIQALIVALQSAGVIPSPG